jgi:D-glycero-alpha-D-manno-heptose-7-phosphate kinase
LSEHPGCIEATAPVRTADVGGWTDTWFAGTGVVCNVALAERARVRVTLPETERRSGIDLRVALTGESYSFAPGAAPGRHPMLEAVVGRLRPPDGSLIEVGGDLEAGSGLGSSAAVMVALAAALSAATGAPTDPASLAVLAHSCEVSVGRESGVQDHVAAAFGGVSLVEVDYPRFDRAEVPLTPETSAMLVGRLHTVSFGRPHASSSIHHRVIDLVERPSTPRALERIRVAARSAAAALATDRTADYGAALVESHEAMRSLYEGIISAEADELAAAAGACGSLGWKVNGAGGEGGSMVVLGPEDHDRNEDLVRLIARHPRWHVVDCPVDAAGVVVRRVSSASSGDR